MSYNLLKGKKGIVFGALNEQSIAWKVAEKAVAEGASITLSNTPDRRNPCSEGSLSNEREGTSPSDTYRTFWLEHMPNSITTLHKNVINKTFLIFLVRNPINGKLTCSSD